MTPAFRKLTRETHGDNDNPLATPSIQEISKNGHENQTRHIVAERNDGEPLRCRCLNFRRVTAVQQVRRLTAQRRYSIIRSIEQCQCRSRGNVAGSFGAEHVVANPQNLELFQGGPNRGQTEQMRKERNSQRRHRHSHGRRRVIRRRGGHLCEVFPGVWSVLDRRH